MGAWGEGPFENDAALDFTGPLSEEPADAVVAGLRDAMTGVLESGGPGGSGGYVEGPDMDAAIAAACLVAARLDPDVPIDRNGEYYLGQMEFTVDAKLRGLAGRVFDRAFRPENNEWHELWAEGGDESLGRVAAALAPFRAAEAPPAEA